MSAIFYLEFLVFLFTCFSYRIFLLIPPVLLHVFSIFVLNMQWRSCVSCHGSARNLTNCLLQIFCALKFAAMGLFFVFVNMKDILREESTLFLRKILII